MLISQPAGTNLERSYAACHEIMERGSRSFTMATRFLPPAKRAPTEALYAVFRTLDDIADRGEGAGHPAGDAREALDRWAAWFERDCEGEPPDDPVAPAFQHTQQAFAIPPRLFVSLTAALRSDLDTVRYRTLDDLLDYCFGVASTVGLAMCRVLGASGGHAYARAAELGVAMQLTNVLRDVGEDYAMGRVYLPSDLMQTYGVSMAALQGDPSPGYIALVRHLAGIAHWYYHRGMGGIADLPLRARPAIRIAAAVYRDILHSIEQNGYDNVGQRAYTTASRKVWIAVRYGLLPAGSNGRHPPCRLPAGSELILRQGAALSTSG